VKGLRNRKGFLLVHDEPLLVIVVLIHKVISDETLSAVLADAPAIRLGRPDIVEERPILLEVTRKNGQRMLAEDELPIGVAIDVRLQDVILDNGFQILKLISRVTTRILKQGHSLATVGGVGLPGCLLFCEDRDDRLLATRIPKSREVPNLDLGLGCICPRLAVEEPIASSLLTNELQRSADHLACRSLTQETLDEKVGERQSFQ
jgi:hypothetical protein